VIDAGRTSAFLALDILRGERVFCADLDRCDEFKLYVMRRAPATLRHSRRSAADSCSSHEPLTSRSHKRRRIVQRI